MEKSGQEIENTEMKSGCQFLASCLTQFSEKLNPEQRNNASPTHKLALTVPKCWATLNKSCTTEVACFF